MPNPPGITSQRQTNAAGILGWLNFLDYGGFADNDHDDGAVLNSLVGGLTNGVVVLPPGTYNIATSVTVPSNVTLVISNGVTLNGAGTISVSGTGSIVDFRAGVAITGTFTTGTQSGTGVTVTNIANGYTLQGANGQLLQILALTELTTIAAAATTSSTIQIPAGAVVLGVPVRVTVTIPTAASMTVGDSGNANRYSTGSNIPVSAGTTDPGTKGYGTTFAAATSILFTPNLTPGTNAGRVRTTIFYTLVTPPTS